MATVGLGDVTTYLGWTAGWDTGFASNGGSTFLGGAATDIGEDSRLTYIATIGRIGNGTDQSGYSHSIVWNHMLTERLNFVTQTDLVDFEGDVDGQRFAIGWVNYFIYQLNDRWSAGTRVEWWQTELAPGNMADLIGLTTGLNYRPTQNLVIRPEIRWNRDNDNFIIPTEDNQRLGFGCDFVFSF